MDIVEAIDRLSRFATVIAQLKGSPGALTRILGQSRDEIAQAIRIATEALGNVPVVDFANLGVREAADRTGDDVWALADEFERADAMAPEEVYFRRLDAQFARTEHEHNFSSQQMEQERDAPEDDYESSSVAIELDTASEEDEADDSSLPYIDDPGSQRTDPDYEENPDDLDSGDWESLMGGPDDEDLE